MCSEEFGVKGRPEQRYSRLDIVPKAQRLIRDFFDCKEPSKLNDPEVVVALRCQCRISIKRDLLNPRALGTKTTAYSARLRADTQPTVPIQMFEGEHSLIEVLEFRLLG